MFILSLAGEGPEVASRLYPDIQRWLAEIGNRKLPESSTEAAQSQSRRRQADS